MSLAPKLPFETRSAAEGLSLDREKKRELPLRSRVMIGLLDKIGLTKEAKETNTKSITDSFDKITKKMETAIAGSVSGATVGPKKAECPIFWPGSSEEDPKYSINVEYNKLEDGTEVIGIDTGPAIGFLINGDPVVSPNPMYAGRTVFERNPQGDLGVDLNGDGHVVPLNEIGAIDGTIMAPLLDGIQQDIGNRGHDIRVVGANGAAVPTELAA